MSFDLSTDRRTLLSLSTVAIAAGIVPLPGVAQETEDEGSVPTSYPQPSIDARHPAEIAPGVFVIPDRRIPLVPNVGIIVGSERALVVDCGLGIDSAEAVLDTARRLAPGREIVLTLTHAHPEHGFGAQVFATDERIFYNAPQAEHLARAGQPLLDGFRAAVLPPEHRFLLDGIEITPPTETYDGTETRLDLGGREAVLRSVGLAHSPGDQIVHLPDAGVIFAGDLIEERIYPIVPYFPPLIGADDIDLPTWRTALGMIADLAPTIIVPGHGSLGGTELPEAVSGYFDALEDVAAGGGDLDAMVAEVHRRYPTWEQAGYIPPALQYLTR
ncbi:MBL fold metallo-hydrolase [uncultured Roseobacter sp.]|uniref:MBL fold metallo-hydrolase n=1 Tax=uncultured Roseobacter sp. TaxID=114847 RepID=UPI0026099207|nr:MBL fold metallo-hydrolase [uncultured Roseobacter sp.]